MNKKTFQKILAVILLLAIWQAAAMAVNQSIILASPVSVIGRLFTIWKEEDFFSTIFFSFLRICGGYLLGFFAAIILAIISAKSGIVETLIHPLFVTIKSVPVASFVILALVWFTSGKLSVFISFLMVLPVIYNNVLEGIHSIDKKVLEMADVFKLSWIKRFVFLWLPAIKSSLLSGCKTALGLAWKAGIAAEVIGIPDGSIGEKLYMSKAYLNITDLFAWTVIIVLISVAFEKAFLYLLKVFYRRLEKL